MATKRGRPSDIGQATKRELKESAAEPNRPHDLDQFERVARHVTTALAQNNYDLARVALEAEIKQLQEEAERKPIFECLLSDIGFDHQCCFFLEQELNVVTVGQFMSQPLARIQAIRGIGTPRTIEMLRLLLVHAFKYVQE